ncbi:MAG: sensor histidine kinase [Myxococcales bacterium]|nr:sensor histidine kinase [Myxococcales bacterium]
MTRPNTTPSRLASLFERARALVATPTDLYLSLDDEAALEQHLRAVILRNSLVSGPSLTAATIVTWPTDRWLLSPERAALLGRFRLCELVVFGLASALLLVPSIAKRPMLVVAPAMFAGMGIVNWYTARMGDLDSPWFALNYLAVVATVIVPTARWPRVALLVFGAISIVASYLWTRPSTLAHPLLGSTALVFLFALVCSYTVGGLVYSLYERGFRSERQLAKLNLSLASKVREQTSDLQRLASDLDTARERERLVLAHTVHDELGQELAALRFAVGLARDRYEKNPANISANLEALSSLVADIGTSTQQLVAELRPKILEDQGLQAALEWFAKRSRERFALEVTLDTQGELSDLGPSSALIAFRCAQEAMTNAVRHGEARSVSIHARCDDEWFELEFVDDGRGFDVEQAPRTSMSLGGTGLISLRERALSAGGEFVVRSSPGEGTRLFLRLPRTRASSAELA